MNQEGPQNLDQNIIVKKRNIAAGTIKYMLHNDPATSVELWKKTYQDRFDVLLEQPEMLENLATMEIRPFIYMMLKELKAQDTKD